MSKFFIYYDGDCPFCNRYAEILKLKKCLDLSICDARVDLKWKDYKKDLVLDDGVILIVENECYQGTVAIEMLLSICKFEGAFFSLQKFIFSNKILANIVYTCFKFFRKIALAVKS